MSVAIVGAGITGLSVAWHLRERGIDATVYERSGVGAGQSGVMPGGVRQQWSTRENCLLAREAVQWYAEHFGDRLDRCGYVFLAHSDDALAALARNVAVQNEAGVPSRIVSPDEAAQLVPGLVPDTLAGAAWCGEDGYFDNGQAIVEAFGKEARVELAEIEAVEPDGEGWLLRGPDVRADQVVVAAGADSPALVRGLGVELPIQRDARYLFYSEPVRERLLEPLVISAERSFAAKQLANGRVLASDLVGGSRAVVRSAVEELLPQLQYVPLPLLVTGDYDVTPDHQPILGGLDGFPGLWVAAGFSGHGFMMAPAFGRRIAALVAGDDVDLAAFALERFEHAVVPETQVI